MNTRDWVVIEIDDLYDYLLAAQVTAINTAALGVGQTDRFTKTMQDVSNRVRNKVLTCRTNSISETDYSVPPELKWATCYLVIEAMQVSLPTLLLTDAQKEQCTRAVRELDLVASCDLAVTAPTDPQATIIQSTQIATTVVSGGTRLTRDDVDGF